MLIAILAVAALEFQQTNRLSFDWVTLAQHPAGAAAQSLLFLGFALAFAIKMPIFPLHTWLPPAYTSAPVPLVIVSAGLVFQLGAYGVIRLHLCLCPDG